MLEVLWGRFSWIKNKLQEEGKRVFGWNKWISSSGFDVFGLVMSLTYFLYKLSGCRRRIHNPLWCKLYPLADIILIRNIYYYYFIYLYFSHFHVSLALPFYPSPKLEIRKEIIMNFKAWDNVFKEVSTLKSILK